jgi:hypothetical protein
MKTIYFWLCGVLVVCLSQVSCVSLPFDPGAPNLTTKTDSWQIQLEPIVRDKDGDPYMQLSEDIIDYINMTFGNNNSDLGFKKGTIEIEISADSNSRKSKLFEVWKWAGFLTLGIIPVVEKTTYKARAKIKHNGMFTEIEKETNGYIVFNILLFPFNIFRDWHRDRPNAQKSVINKLSDELAQMK